MKTKQTSNSRLCFCCRSLGVHCSKVRSLTLDSWEPELLKVLFVLVVTFNSTQGLHLYIVKNFWEMHLKLQKVSLAYKMVKTISQTLSKCIQLLASLKLIPAILTLLRQIIKDQISFKCWKQAINPNDNQINHFWFNQISQNFFPSLLCS